MSLPKRDGVQGRYYLIQKPDTNPEVLEHADQCIQDVLDGTAKENHSGSPLVVRNQSGTPFLPSQLLDRYPVYGSGNNGHLRRHVSVNS